MRAAVYYNNNDIRIEEMPVPRIGDDEILVKVAACGICGSDVMEWYRIKTAPRVLGHELTGEITRVGSRVKGWKEGDRVMVTHHVPCLKCHYCLRGHESVCDTLRSTNFHPGGFSQYLRVPAINVDRGTYRLPPNMSFDEGTFIEPLACVVRGLRFSNIRPGDTVAVLGSGLTGLLMIQTARAMGAGRIFATDMHPARLEAAETYGAKAVRADGDVAAEIREGNEGRGADLVAVCTGSPKAISQAWEVVGRGGRILFFAPTDPDARVEMPFNKVWKDEVSIVTSYAGPPRDIEAAISLISNRRVDVKSMITHRLPLEKTGEGFRLVPEGGRTLKVIIYPNGPPTGDESVEG
ncbi:MAG: zinc-dependent dehydrogenase [Thermoplasmata archaeon]|nr:zinc-dependent dehydrogenase [Thermoplasmata archaeon]